SSRVEADELRGSGVFGAETPNRAARAVGNDTAVANGAGPPAAPGFLADAGDGARAAVSRPFGRASLTQALTLPLRAGPAPEQPGRGTKARFARGYFERGDQSLLCAPPSPRHRRR